MKRDKLSSVIAFRVPQEVGDEWRKRASDSGMNLGDWVRTKIHINEVDLCITKKQTPRRGVNLNKNFKSADPALIAGVGRVGNNLNQVARWANTHKNKADAVQIIAHLIQLRRATEQLVSHVD